jgi:predicted nuclease of predicted toxin-antitoxin system
MILADENIPAPIIAKLRQAGFEVLSIFESHRGFKDEQVIAVALSLNCPILTEDKDFGEWVFAHHIKNLSVIFLRYPFPDMPTMADRVCVFLTDNALQHPVFVTLTPKKIRIRQL